MLTRQEWNNWIEFTANIKFPFILCKKAVFIPAQNRRTIEHFYTSSLNYSFLILSLPCFQPSTKHHPHAEFCVLTPKSVKCLITLFNLLELGGVVMANEGSKLKLNTMQRCRLHYSCCFPIQPDSNRFSGGRRILVRSFTDSLVFKISIFVSQLILYIATSLWRLWNNLSLIIIDIQIKLFSCG